jgi:hypothetical protein
VLDAQDPIGEVGPTRRQVTRACYPTPGIEIELGETPVLQCSRWEPDGEQRRLGEVRTAYLSSSDGRVFSKQVAAYEAQARLNESAESGGGLTGVDTDLADVSDGNDELADLIIDDAIGGAL